MKFKNTTKHVILLDAIGLPPVGPEETVDVPDAIAAPGRTDAGARSKSVIECVAPQLEPASKADKELWLQTPPPPTPVSRIVTVARRMPQEAPGVKALRELRLKQQADAKKAEAPKPANTTPPPAG